VLGPYRLVSTVFSPSDPLAPRHASLRHPPTPGLSEDVVRAISAKKNEPEWLLEFRLRAYRKWLTMESPVWSDNVHPPIDYQDYSYYRCDVAGRGVAG
jgi:hypothetical protein